MGDCANIRDVARVAGVAVGTVSRVLNNHPSVGDSARKRVQDAIRLLQYRPSMQARRLVTGSTETICFLLGNRDFLRTFHARILQGAQQHASAAGYQVIYTPVTYEPDADPSAIALPKIVTSRDSLDGVILAGKNYPNLPAALDVLDVPYVIFGNNLIGDASCPGADTVSFDADGGAYKATAHLAELGHGCIWFFGNVRLPWFRQRFNGYLKAIGDCGVEGHWVTDLETTDDVEFGHVALGEALQNAKRLTAVVAGNDYTAFGIWKGLQERGLAMPEDVSVTGFDDTELCPLIHPPLTSVSVHNESIGAECTAMLLEKLAEPGKRFPQRILPTDLAIRSSTAPPAAAAQAMAEQRQPLCDMTG